MTRPINSEKGFTLIELLVVITIIGILAAIAIPVFLGQRTKAAISEARSNLTSLRLIEERVFADSGCYAPTPAANETQLEVPANADAAGLRRFLPGTAVNLNYTYEVTSQDADADGCPEAFIAWARPKAGTIVEGTQDFYINSQNQNNF